MPAPHNPFKAALATGRLQLGCWLGMADPYAAEISAGAGFDWLVIDNEHAPNDLRSTVAQLQAIKGSGSHAVVRPPIGETWMIKQLLDAGAQTLLIPMVETADQARDLARAVAYPPHGIRGVGSALARASEFNGITDYLQTARDEICLLLQVESRAALENLDEILKVDGIEGVFIGPADLAADMGHLADAAHPEVEAAIQSAIQKIAASGKAPGILMPDLTRAQRYVDLGALFVATGIDVIAFSAAMRSAATNAKTLKRRA